MIAYQQRCALCGQLQVTEDREALLEDERFEWDEAMVDDFIAGNRHLCVDTDPYGARESARLAEAGLIAPQLDWLIAGELERRQVAPMAAWVVFMGPGASSAMVLAWRPAMACRGLAGGALRPAEGPAHPRLPSGGPGRAPP